MIKPRRLYLLGIALILVVPILLQGCNANQTSNKESDHVITIRELDYFTSDPSDSVMNDLIESFEKTHPNIKIKRSSVDRDTLSMKIIQQGATHSLPSLLVLDNPSLQQVADADILTPLNKLANIDKSDYFSSSLSTVTYKDQLYGLPLGNNTLALFYNKKMFKDKNIEPPKTWDDLLTAAKQLTQGSTYGIAFAAPNNEEGTWQFLPFLWSNGGTLSKIDSQNAIGALNFWKELVDKGYASKSVVNWTQSNVEQQFSHGNAAMMVNGLWELPTLDAVKGLDYGVVQLPVPEEGEQPKVPLGGEVITIPKTSPEKEKAAWTFVEWMQDKERLADVNQQFTYISAYKPAAEDLIKQNPKWKPFYDQFQNGQARTKDLGMNYPVASEAVWTAIQEVLTDKKTAKDALEEVQKKIDQLTYD